MVIFKQIEQIIKIKQKGAETNENKQLRFKRGFKKSWNR